MSQVAISGNASGTGTLTIAAPNTNSNYTLTLPQATTTIVGTDATQTLTNKTIQGGAITSGTAVASTSGTSINFTDIPSWVKRITVMFQGVSTNSTSPPQIQIGAGSVTTSGYLGTNAYIASSGSSFALFTTGFGIGVNTGGWGAGVVFHGAITLSLINTNTWVAAGSVGRSDAAVLYFTDGSIALGGALDRVRITTVNGTDTFDAGTINILYEG
jgi:hypothetical protein